VVPLQLEIRLFPIYIYQNEPQADLVQEGRMNEIVSVVGPLNIDLVVTGQGPEDLSRLQGWQGAANMEMAAAGPAGYIAYLHQHR
jgi:PPE-repeat protein